MFTKFSYPVYYRTVTPLRQNNNNTIRENARERTSETRSDDRL